MNNRIDYIDTAKGIGMLFVIFAHINYTQPSLTIIYSFHMPLFFIISGMMFKKEKYTTFKPFILSRLKSMICPYVFFSIVSYAAYVLMEVVSNGTAYIDISEYIKLFGQIFIAQYSLKMVYNVQLWFIPCLFLTEIIYWIVCNKIANTALRYAITVVIIVFGWFTESPMCHIDFSILPWNFSSACFALGFFAIGNEAFPYVKNIHFSSKFNDIFNAILVLALSVPLLIFLAELNGKISIGSRELNNGFLLYITGILGTIIILVISMLFRKSTVLKFIGLNSFYYMAVHKVLFRFLNHTFGYLEQRGICSIHKLSTTVFSDTIIGFAITLIISTLIVLLYLKLIKPIIISFETKNRLKKSAA